MTIFMIKLFSFYCERNININFLLYSDTVGCSAMFCAAATTINKCKTEGVIDVFQVLKSQRIQKPGSVQTVVSIFLINYPSICLKLA